MYVVIRDGNHILVRVAGVEQFNGSVEQALAEWCELDARFQSFKIEAGKVKVEKERLERIVTEATALGKI